MKQKLILIASLLSLISLNCYQFGEMRTFFKDGDDNLFADKTYGVNSPALLIENTTFSRITQNYCKDLDSTLLLNSLSNFIVLNLDKDKLYSVPDDIDSYDIIIKLDTLYKREYQLNDSNTVVARYYGFSSFYLYSIDGKVRIDSISDIKIRGTVEINTSMKRNNSGKSSCEGKITGDFYVPIRSK